MRGPQGQVADEPPGIDGRFAEHLVKPRQERALAEQAFAVGRAKRLIKLAATSPGVHFPILLPRHLKRQ
jgi:hypothetical protein